MGVHHDTMPETWAANEQEGTTAHSYEGVDNEQIDGSNSGRRPVSKDFGRRGPQESRGLSDILETPLGHWLRHQGRI